MKLSKIVVGLLFFCGVVIAQVKATESAAEDTNASGTIVRFNSGVSEKEAERIIAESNMKIVKRIPELNMYVVKTIGISIASNILASKKRSHVHREKWHDQSVCRYERQTLFKTMASSQNL